uniref:aquaporin n=1 Tax=Salmonella sp. s51228 TaxID=3159652 RepID=UPI0039817C3C
YTCAGVSGGHINSAITIALGVTGRFPLRKVPFYVLAQFLGSFVASFLVFLYYFDAMNYLDNGSREFNGVNETFRIWITNPQDHVSNLTHFWDQFWSTFLFLFLILATFDRPNAGVPHSFKPIAVGLIVFALSVAFGYNCGGGVNPIRDFPPRCFVAIMWGAGVFPLHDYYFFVPIFAPILGGTVGTIAYTFFIETHHYPAAKPVSPSESKRDISEMEMNKKGNTSSYLDEVKHQV